MIIHKYVKDSLLCNKNKWMSSKILGSDWWLDGSVGNRIKSDKVENN